MPNARALRKLPRGDTRDPEHRTCIPAGHALSCAQPLEPPWPRSEIARRPATASMSRRISAYLRPADGENVDMAAVGNAHAGRNNRLNRLADSPAVQKVAVVAVQVALRLDRANEVQPDLILLRPQADDCTTSHATGADVPLLVEIAHRSLDFGRGTTLPLPLYARHGVPEVWIVDRVGRSIEVFREPRGGVYGTRERASEARVTAGLVPEFGVDVPGVMGA